MPRHMFQMTSRRRQGRRLDQHIRHHALNIFRRDGINLSTRLLRTLTLVIRQDLTSHVLKEYQSRFQLRQDVAFEHIPSPTQLYLVDGLNGQACQLVCQDRDQFSHLGGGRRTGTDAKEATLFGKGRKGLGGFHPTVSIQHLLIHARVHALAGTAGRKGTPAAQQGLQDARRDHTVVVPTSDGETQRHATILHFVIKTVVHARRLVGVIFDEMRSTSIDAGNRRRRRLLRHVSKFPLRHFHQCVMRNAGPGNDHPFRIVDNVGFVKVFDRRWSQQIDRFRHCKMQSAQLLIGPIRRHLYGFSQYQLWQLLLRLKLQHRLGVVKFRIGGNDRFQNDLSQQVHSLLDVGP
mmetsp:Transcript_133493/g.198457  ORF Transcript_133493/g.198457 Transcript_133493/m.198457 type:complete len:348 (-) Transcript_133493:842-1885(-)